MTQQTIKQIKNMINSNVDGITNIEKQSGTNVWFIVAKQASPEIAAVELKAIGFKILAVNLKTSMIVAEYDRVNNIHYAIQIKVCLNLSHENYLQTIENHKHILELRHQINLIDTKLDAILAAIEELKERESSLYSWE